MSQPPPPTSNGSPSDKISDLLAQADRAQQSGDLHGAEQAYRSILAIDRRQAVAAHNLAGILGATGRRDEAIALMEHAVSLRPDDRTFRLNQGRLLRQYGRFKPAAETLVAILSRTPRDAEVFYELGLTIDLAGRPDQAMEAHTQALQINPDHVEARFALATILARLNRRKAAIDELREALKRRPGDAKLESMLGGLLAITGSISEGITLTRSAAEKSANNPTAWWDHATAALRGGDAQDAFEAMQRVIQLAPHWSTAYSQLLDVAQYVHPDDPAKQRSLHEGYERNCLKAVRRLPPLVRERAIGQRLRIGYLSHNFRQHPVAHFLEPLWAAHDRERFELHAFHTNPTEDEVTKRLRTHAHWHPVHTLADPDALADAIRAAELDVLIELDGHTGGNRLDAVARKPAPVQLSYLGYANTTGLSAIDGRITDVVADPPDQTEAFHTERLLRLPDTLGLFAPPGNAPPVASPKADRPLTLASAARPAKANNAVLAAWADALRRLPEAKLILIANGYDDPYVRSRVRDRLASLDVDPARLEFIGMLPFDQYLAAHERFDLMIDTFPFNGHTTTVQHLWMGVPMVTCAGVSHRNRLGASVLTTIGLTDFIANGESTFADKIVQMASDRDWLTYLRETMRDRMLASPLMDAPRFARNFETLIEEAIATSRERRR